MIHYSIWFWPTEGASEVALLQRIFAFLSDMQHREALDTFTLLRNRSAGSQTQVGPLQALITFRSVEQFREAFRSIEHSGVRSGLHGAMVEMVSRFQPELFEVIDPEGLVTQEDALP